MIADTARKMGIKGKLVLSFALLIASIAIFVFIFFPARLERQAMDSMMSKADGVRDITAYSVSAGLVFDDTVGVRDVLAASMRARSVRFALVRDNAGKPIVAYGSDEWKDLPAEMKQSRYTTSDGLLYVSTRAIAHGDQELGWVTLGVSLAELRRDVAEARGLGAVVGAIIFFVGLMLVYAISRMVTRPLTSVAQTMNRIAAGDLSLRASEATDREIAELGRAFNRMVDAVAGAQIELSAANQGLETRVEERTAELQEAVTTQRRVQEALALSEADARANSETLQSLIDVAPQAIVAVDVEWRVTRWNRAAERTFGWTFEEVVGKPVPYVPAEDAEVFRSRQQTIVEKQWLDASEVERVRKDGKRIAVLVSSGVLRNRSGDVSGYIAIVTDLSERKLLEEQLRQSQKMEAVGRLAGGVAHDFNNLLTVITSYSAMLLEQDRSTEDRADLEQITEAALRASALTRQLLTFSRKQIVQLSAVNLNDTVSGMGPMLKRLLRENIRWTTVLGEELDCVMADPTQLEQVIMNLAVNASDAMPEGGKLTLETRSVVLNDAYAAEHSGAQAGRHVMLEMTDTGIGMDAETLTRIFEPFFTTKEVGRGTGLGLATTYAVVSQLGGHITVTSKLGAGTVFRIFIPSLVQPPAALALATGPAVASAGAGSGELVLLVEDEDGVRRVIRRGLEHGGFRVLEAPDGEVGLRLAAEYGVRIDVLVTDLMMPGINGRKVADAVVKHAPRVRIVYMSGYADDTVDRDGLIAPGRAFLQKPFTTNELARAIRELTSAAKIKPAA